MANLDPDTAFSTKPEDAKTYLEALEKNLAAAETAYATNNALAQKKKTELDRAKNWRDQLKTYSGAVEKTDELAADVLASFKKLASRATQVGGNAGKSNRAFQIMLVDMYRLTECVEIFKCEVDKCVAALASAAASDPLLLALKKLQKGLDEAFLCAKEALLLWLKVYKMSEILSDQVGDKGFVELLRRLFEDFEQGQSSHDWAGLVTDADCGVCGVPTKVGFPLTKNIGILKGELAKIEACILKCSAAYEAAATAAAEALACKEAFEAALKTAKATNECKTK